MTLLAYPELIDELLLPKNYGLATQLFNIELMNSKAFSYTFSPKQIRAISLFSRDLADHIIKHKMYKLHAFIDGLYYCDMSLLYTYYSIVSIVVLEVVQLDLILSSIVL